MTDAVLTEPASEWVAAFEVQQRFLQHLGPCVDSLDYGGQCRQMDEVGGDFYNFAALSGNRLAVAIGDASGKGFAAALMIANVQSSLRTASLFAGRQSGYGGPGGQSAGVWVFAGVTVCDPLLRGG